MSITIRRAEVEDAESLSALALITFEQAFKHRSTPDAYDTYVNSAFNPDRIKAEINEPRTDYYLALDNNQQIAYMRLRQDRPRPDLPKNQLEMQRLYVAESHWRKGIGEQLLAYAMQLFAQSGGGWLWLVVWSENYEAIAFYEKHGFEQFAWYDFDFGSEIHHDPVMRVWVANSKV